MALKRVRFCWGTPRLPDGRWRVVLFNMQEVVSPRRPLPPGGVPHYWDKYRSYVLYINVFGVLLWGGAMALGLFLTVAAMVLRNLERDNPYNRVTYADLVLPQRWSQLSRLRGEGLLALGQSRLEAEDYRPTIAYLRAGLARHPAGFAARADLARLYVRTGLRAQVGNLLSEGLNHGYPGRDYLDLASALAADEDQPAEWLALMRRAETLLSALSPEEQPAGDAEWILGRIIEAQIADGDPEGAWGELMTRGHPVSAWREPRARVLVLLKRFPEAIAEAKLGVEEAPGDALALRLLVSVSGAAGDHAVMDGAVAALRALDPRKMANMFFALKQFYVASRPDAARALLDDLILRYGADRELYRPLADVIAEAGAKEDLARLERELKSLGYPLFPIYWGRLAIAAGEHDWAGMLAAANTLRSISDLKPTATQADWLPIAERLALAGLDPSVGTQTSLVEIMAKKPGTLRLYRLVLDALLAAQRFDTAAAVVSLAEGPYPQARSIVDLRREIAAWREQERQVTADASDKVPRRREWASAEDFYDEYEELNVAGRLDEALALLVAARLTRSDWVGSATDRLNALELPQRVRLEDLPAVQFLARTTLSRGVVSSVVAIDLAQKQINVGKRSVAVTLLNEVVRHEPENMQARALLRTLAEPPVPLGE